MLRTSLTAKTLVPDNIKAMKNNKEGEATTLPKTKKIKAEKKSPDVTTETEEEENRPAKSLYPHDG